jgi:hypothetical protein
MISILLSVLFFAVVKEIFLSLFAPKEQRVRRLPCALPHSEDSVSLQGKRDARAGHQSLRFRLTVAKDNCAEERLSLPYVVLPGQLSAGGQK